MKSKFKKILLQSTVFTCLSAGISVTMALDLDRETTASKGYHPHHAANFVNVAANNPVMKAIKEQQQAHRKTIMADVNLMLGAITDTTVKKELTNLKNMIAAALTADADAINDIEDKHDAKKTATVTETAETLLTKATLYKGAKDAGSIPSDIQHYRLAYFLMLKLKPWLANNYKNDPDEVDTLLKNHIPTYYPEWTDKKISIKGLILTLDNTENDAKEPKIKFSTAQKNIPEGIIVYSYIDDKSNKVDGSKYTITLSDDGSDATIKGLTEYGIYYVVVDGVKQYFAVNSTKENQFIYSSDGIVKFKTAINKGLKIAAEENKDFRPKLSLLRNGKVLGTDTFKVRLKNDTTWKKLDDFETNEFLRSDHDLEFSGLNPGKYTFEAVASDKVIMTLLSDDGDDIEIGANTESTEASQSFEVLKSIVEFTATAANKTYDGKTTATITSWSAEANNKDVYKSSDTTDFASKILLTGTFMDAEVGKAKTVDGTVSFKLGSYRTAFLATYQILPRFTTTADITTTPTPTPTPTPTTPKLEFKEIKPNSGSPFLIATGTAANIPEGSYEVLITTDSDTDGVTKTIDVDADNKFEVSLYELMLGARGELVTVRTTATAGRYRDISFTFTSPTMTADFDDAIDSEGSVTFTVGTDFDTIRPTVALKAGNAVTGYSNISTIANGTFTATYTTSIASGTFIPEGTITIEGTDFTFTGNTVTASS